MKSTTINAILTKKMKAWQETIDDVELREAVKRDTIITGGCIASMLLREKVNDYDIYFKTHATALAVTDYYVKKFKEARKAASGIDVPILVQMGDSVEDRQGGGRIKIIVKSAGVASSDDSGGEYEYFESRPPEEAAAYVSEVMDDPSQIEDAHEALEEKALTATDEKYEPVFMSTNAITLSGKIQLIIRFFGDASDIHKNYDFVHCTNYWTKKDGVVLNQAALESLITKELRYVGSKYPLCSLIRVRKFVARQWTINAGQIVKMAFQLNQLDLNDIKVLEDQLTGVDVAYFSEVIRLMKDKNPDRVDATYLLEIINRMF